MYPVEMRALVAICLLLAGCGREHSPVEGKIWLGGIEWKPAPEGASESKYSDGTVLQFLPNGDFRLVECHLIGWRGQVGISRGDGYGRHNGTWRVAGRNQIQVHYRLDTPTRVVSRPWVTGPWKDEVIAIRGETLLQLGSMQFRPSTEIDQESLDFILRD